MSLHKNYIEWYWRDRNTVINERITPYQDTIFDIFSKKFQIDAQDDTSKWRIKLRDLWLSCADECYKIHSILKKDEKTIYTDNEAALIVNDIINMDYNSVANFFETLKTTYKGNHEIIDLLNDIQKNVEEMRSISKKHVQIITENQSNKK